MYNGHKNKNQWNVSLWINNTESMYNEAVRLVKAYGQAKAARMMYRNLEGTRTPDGARYSRIAIFNALDGILD